MPFLGTITYPGSLSNSTFLDSGFEYCKCSPLPEEMIQFDEHIVQRGWFNHPSSLEDDDFSHLPHFAGDIGFLPWLLRKHHDSYATRTHLSCLRIRLSRNAAWCRFRGSWPAFPVKCGLIGRFKAYFWPGELFCVHVNLEKMLKLIVWFYFDPQTWMKIPSNMKFQTWGFFRRKLLETCLFLGTSKFQINFRDASLHHFRLLQ